MSLAWRIPLTKCSTSCVFVRLVDHVRRGDQSSAADAHDDGAFRFGALLVKSLARWGGKTWKTLKKDTAPNVT